MRRRQPRLDLDRANHDGVGLLGDEGERVRLAVLAVLGQHLHQLLGAGHLLLEQPCLLEELDDPVTVRGAQRGRPPLVLLEQPAEPLPAGVGKPELLVVAIEDVDLLELVAEQDVLELGLALEVSVFLPAGQPVQRRLGDIHVAGLDQRLHLAEQERQRKRADVGAVDVRVGQQHDLVVARLGDVELVADSRPDRRDQRLDLRVGQNLVDPALLDVEDLPAQGQDRLGTPVPGAHRRAAGRVSLDHEQLRQRRILDRAVGELARKRRVLERGLAPGQVARLARGGACLRGLDRLADRSARVLGVLLQELGQTRIDDRVDEALHAGVAELGLGLALELWVLKLGRDDRGEAFADVLAAEVVVLLLELALVARVLVERAGQRRAEAAEMAASLDRVDVVGEREDRLLVGGVPLHRDLDRALLALTLERDDLLSDRLLVPVQVLDEVDDPALVAELGPMAEPSARRRARSAALASGTPSRASAPRAW